MRKNPEATLSKGHSEDPSPGVGMQETKHQRAEKVQSGGNPNPVELSPVEKEPISLRTRTVFLLRHSALLVTGLGSSIIDQGLGSATI